MNSLTTIPRSIDLTITLRGYPRIRLPYDRKRLCVDETLLPRYVNLSTNFRRQPFSVGDGSFMNSVLFAFTGRLMSPADCSKPCSKEFGFGRCIWKKRHVICILCKCRKYAGRDEISPEVWKSRKVDDLLLRFYLYTQNTIERWAKAASFTSPRKVTSESSRTTKAKL